MARDFSGGFLEFGTIGALGIPLNTQPMSVGAWVRPDVVTGRHRIMSYSAGLSGWSWGLEGAQVRFTKLSIVDMTTSTLACTAAAWQFVGCGTVGDDWIFVHVTPAGVVTTQSFFGAGAGSPGYGGAAAAIATRSGAETFDGRIAEVSVYDAKLTAEELAAVAFGAMRARDPIFYAPVWGASDPEPELAIGGISGSVNTPASALLADHAPVGPPFPIAV